MRLLAIAASVWLLASALPVPQSPTTFRVVTDIVPVHVTVRGADGTIVRDLTRNDFEVFDNGARREITSFSSEPMPIAAAIVLDRSGSLASAASSVAAAGDAFIQHLLPGDRASLHTLTWDCQSLTDSKADLRAAARSRLPSDPGSPIWAALDRAVSIVGQTTGRRAVLLVSDGDDTGPTPLLAYPQLRGRPQGTCHFAEALAPLAMSLEGVSKHVERDGTLVYAMSVGEPMHLFGSTLGKVATRSGGKRFVLTTAADLTAAFTEIGDELHHQYLLGFSTARPDGKVHQIDVRVARSGLTVRARRSYVATDAPAPKATSANASIEDRDVTTSPNTAAIDDAAVESAINGRDQYDRVRSSCRLDPLPRRSNRPQPTVRPLVNLEGPIARIMRVAHERGAAFGLTDVTGELRAPIVEATVTLESSSSMAGVYVWLERKDPDWVALPAVSLITIRNQVKAGFDLAAFRQLGTVRTDVVVTGWNTERHCSISGEVMRAIR